jgi:hypothetical protein
VAGHQSSDLDGIASIAFTLNMTTMGLQQKVGNWYILVFSWMYDQPH